MNLSLVSIYCSKLIMKLIKQTMLYLLILLLSSVLNDMPAVANEHISVCQERKLVIAWHQYKPYAYYSEETQEVSGLDIELLTSLLDEIGCQYEFTRMTWQRTLLELKKGRVDISIFAFVTEERIKEYNFSNSYRDESVRIAMLSENHDKWPIKSLPDIEKYQLKLAHDTHVWAGEAFQKFIDKNAEKYFVHVHGTKTRLEMLLKERVNGIVGDPLTIQLEAEALGKSELIEFADFTIFDNPVHFIMSKQSTDQELVDSINKTLAKSLSAIFDAS